MQWLSEATATADTLPVHLQATTDITHPWAATAAATALFRLLPVMAMSQAMGVMDEYVMKAFVQVAAQMNMCYEEVHASAEAMDKVSQLL
jgi:hypothetical protein